MIVKSAFLIMAPDGDPDRHRTSVKTSMTEITVVVFEMMNFDQAVTVCRDLVKGEGVQVIFLCPGFTHDAVARIAEAAGEKVAVYVARGDNQSNQRTNEILSEAGFFSGRE